MFGKKKKVQHLLKVFVKAFNKVGVEGKSSPNKGHGQKAHGSIGAQGERLPLGENRHPAHPHHSVQYSTVTRLCDKARRI